MKNVIEALRSRGFIDAMTSDEIEEWVQKPVRIYCGFDPTSDSLHLGNLIGIMGLAWFAKFGHTPVAIVGGATGMIGDPSGRSAERNLLDAATLAKNLEGIGRSLKAVLKTDAELLNNYDWFKGFGYLDFLRDVGKHFRLGTMLAKESVKTRLASEDGLSYTEFSYQLLQAYDFLHLYDKHKVTVQIGGSDQWGNITAGTELIRKMRGASSFGVTFPLLTRSDGKKFGKSEGGAIWLNPEKLPPYDFYQYLFRLPDADMPKMFRMLTFLPLEEIEEIESAMRRQGYVPNTAQKRLAEEVTRIVHGEKGLEEALRITEAALPGAKTMLDSATLKALAGEIPTHKLAREAVVGVKLVDLFVVSTITTSKGEARRLIANGGIYLNNVKVDDEHYAITASHLIDERYLLIGVGKKKKVLIEVV